MDIPILELVRWVHAFHSPEEIASRLQEANRRIAESRRFWCRVHRDGGEVIAAAYFLCLPGRVATLGGVRAQAGAEHVAASLVNGIAQELLSAGIAQCQCVTPVADDQTRSLLESCDFALLTQVAHIYADVQIAGVVAPPQLEDVGFRCAQDFSAKRLANIIAETFAYTQDCPELDGLRSEQDVLCGFLDGRRLRATDRWEVVEVDGKPIGVLCLNRAGNEVTELSYFGVSPSARGRGLGASLAGRAMASACTSGDKFLAAAVDQRNLPALRTYERLGFRHHQSFDVWLHRSHVPQT